MTAHGALVLDLWINYYGGKSEQVTRRPPHQGSLGVQARATHAVCRQTARRTWVDKAPLRMGMNVKMRYRPSQADDAPLHDGARIAVLGGGPAGSFFSYFLLEMSWRHGLDVSVDIYEPRDFDQPGPGGCNMCGGIVSESLVQTLATEGILLPPTVVQRGIEAYELHTDAGSVRIDTPAQEKRIGAVHRGAGPRGEGSGGWDSFDGHLLRLALHKGATLHREAIVRVDRENSRPVITTKSGQRAACDLLVVACGVNTAATKLWERVAPQYRPPGVTKTAIREYRMSQAVIDSALGDCMHLFLLNIPRLEFAAVIPKGNYATLCLLGEQIDGPLLDSFLQSSAVERRFPRRPEHSCGCHPRMSISAARLPYGNHLVFIGDCAISRLYKDGIGAAYRTAKAAATTAVFHGVSARAFETHFAPACRAIEIDNRFGYVVFFVTRQIQRRRFAQRAVLRMVRKEQQGPGKRAMSGVLWDTFTGSASYRAIFMRTLHPVFWMTLAWNIMLCLPGSLVSNHGSAEPKPRENV